MAGTLERLKRANRRGAQEQNWQRVLLSLEQEMPEELRGELETIQQLRTQIGRVREEREGTEREWKETQVLIGQQDLSHEIAELQTKIKDERGRCSQLRGAIEKERRERQSIKVCYVTCIRCEVDNTCVRR